MHSSPVPDIFSEDHLDLHQARALVPGRPSYMSMNRYAGKGARGRDGQFHQLETFKSANKRFTSRQAIDRFLRAINQASRQPSSSPAQKQRRAKSVEIELANLGVLTDRTCSSQAKVQAKPLTRNEPSEESESSPAATGQMQ